MRTTSTGINIRKYRNYNNNTKNVCYRNDLKTRKAQIVKTYDSRMMEKHKNVMEVDSKIKKIEDNIHQLQVSR